MATFSTERFKYFALYLLLLKGGLQKHGKEQFGRA
jgi:hypothetical protein